MFTKKFWKDATERAVRTFAQASLGVLGADLFTSVGLKTAAITVGVATAGSVLMSLAGSTRGDPTSASLTKE